MEFQTRSGGLVRTGYFNSRISGHQFFITIDQSANIKNGDDEVTLALTNDEVKDLISMLNNHIIYSEGKPFVILAEPLLHPDVHIHVMTPEGEKEVEKNPDFVNPFLNGTEEITPGEIHLNKKEYFQSILPKITTVK
jgi:hypothetical protein